MNRKLALVIIALALASVVAAIRLGGGSLWNKALELHGIQPESTKAGVISKGWPATKAGALARQWVDAFNSGEPAMQSFLVHSMSARSLEERNLQTRISTYRELKAKYGRQTLKGVTRSEPFRTDAALSANDGTERSFVFEIEKNPPYKLRSVRILERQQHRRSGH